MLLAAAAAALAIIVQDHTALRAAPQSGASELTTLWQGDLIEVRGERAGYLKVYDYRRERGGYLRREEVRTLSLTEGSAPELLAVLRFLRDSSGSEALGISYGAAYIRAASARSLTAEPFDAVAGMAERLADHATGGHFPNTAAHLEVVEQFGIRMRSFERNGRTKVCYDGELYRRVLTFANATPEQRAHAALALTRPDCIDPDMGTASRGAYDEERSRELEGIDAGALSPAQRSRLHARRAGVWASIAFERARRREAAAAAAQQALTELLAVNANDLGEDFRSEYSEAAVRVGAVRWAALAPPIPAAPPYLSAVAGEPGQTCLSLRLVRDEHSAALLKRCTFGIVWLASVRAIGQSGGLAVAVQPLESWRELWIFHPVHGNWRVDILSPGSDEPEQGYIEYAGFAADKHRVLLAREVREKSRFVRRFEERRMDDLALVRQAGSPELLVDFGRWQDAGWRRTTVALR